MVLLHWLKYKSEYELLYLLILKCTHWYQPCLCVMIPYLIDGVVGETVDVIKIIDINMLFKRIKVRGV